MEINGQNEVASKTCASQEEPSLSVASTAGRTHEWKQFQSEYAPPILSHVICS